MAATCESHIGKLPALQTQLKEAKAAGDIAPALGELGQWFDTRQTDRATLTKLGGTTQGEALEVKTVEALSGFYSGARETLGTDTTSVAAFDGVLQEHGYLASARKAYDDKVAAALAAKQKAELAKARAEAQKKIAAQKEAAQKRAAEAAAALAGAGGEIPEIPADLSGLVSDIVGGLDIKTTPEGGVKINGEDFDPFKALQELQNGGGGEPGELPSFLDGLIKPEQMEEMRKQAEQIQPSPEQLKQLEQMQKQLEGLFAPAPAGQ